MEIASKRIGKRNLYRYLSLADDIDIEESKTAYHNYRSMMRMISELYEFPLDKTTAAFCALSPNNDYFGNLRSLVSVLHGLSSCIEHERIVISTYNHCKFRAISYLLGIHEFVAPERGLKILSFYQNIMEPESYDWVTIDGHISAAYNGNPDATMKESILTKKNYAEIQGVLFEIAKELGEIPNAVQARIWLTRKRVYKIKYTPNLDMLREAGDQSGILIDPDLIKAYPIKQRLKNG